MTAPRFQWLYLDMNSFFASVEQELNPSLRGRPVAVVPLLADTTSCIAVSYEGKAFGIKTGTKVGEAKRLCPQMQFVVGNHKNYIQFHNQIVAAVDSCLPVEAICSIDEIACRLTGSQEEEEKAVQLAWAIKKQIRETVGARLTCSIGLAPNRYLAKIAADMKKPDGLTLIRQQDLPQILYSLKLRDLPGIGAKTEEKLNRRGVFSVERLLALSADEARFAWGSIVGEEVTTYLRGHNANRGREAQKSISHSQVLGPQFRNGEAALRVLKKLTDKAALRLRKQKCWATKLEIFVRFIGKDPWKKNTDFFQSQDTGIFLAMVSELWAELPSGTILAVGMSLSGLAKEEERAPSLFDDKKRESLTLTIDRLNEKFGRDKVHYGAVHESAGLAPLRIAFTQIPEEDDA